MKRILLLAIAPILFVSFTSIADAATPEQICQSRKNVEVARFVNCRQKVLSGLSESRFRTSISNCERRFTARWRKIIRIADKSQASCFDAPLKAVDFRTAIENQLLNITSLVGRNQKGNIHKRKCRAVKIVAAGRYAACKHKAESRLVRTGDTAAYNNRVARCESNLEATWQRITSRTAERGTTCFDADQSVAEYIAAIDSHTEKLTKVLAGTDEFDPVSLSVTNSPLALITSGSSQALTITNTSTKATAVQIEADLTDTALEGNVSVTGNTCSMLTAGQSCTLTFTPGNIPVTATEITIQGTNTESVTALIEVVAPATATLSVTGSPLALTKNGPTGNIQITNTSEDTTALAIESDFSSTALAGNVTETGNTCSSVPPGTSCTLTFTPGNTIVASTSFTVRGSNTVTLTPALSVESGTTLTAIVATSGTAAGGTGVTLTGTGLTGATSVTFDGLSASSVNVINSTTVTAVTPAHAAGTVDVAIDTPAGGATLTAGFTYLATAVGQPSGGGTISCLNGGLSNLIAASADNAVSVEWGGSGTATGASSTSDGAANTVLVTSTLGNNGGTPYAAQICDDLEVDSQGNTPCQAGNTCYDDWFLPAGGNNSFTGQLNCLFTNRFAIGGFASASYWSSTESAGSPLSFSYIQSFADGFETQTNKISTMRVRCVRAFSP
jgi:hypothetical protein